MVHLLYMFHDYSVNGSSQGCNGSHSRVQIMSVNNPFMGIIIPYGCHSIENGDIKALPCKLLDENVSGWASIDPTTASVT